MRKMLIIVFLYFFGVHSMAQEAIGGLNEALDLLAEAKTAFDNGNSPLAEKKLEKSIATFPYERTAHTLMFKVLNNQSLHEKALLYLGKAMAIFEEDDEFYYYVAKTHQVMGQNEKALIAYNEAIHWAKKNGEDYPIVFDYYAGRGKCLLRKDLYKEALADFEYSIKLNNKHSSVYIYQGYALMKLNRKDEACESWKKAIQLGGASVKKKYDKYCACK
ncbi:MAG: hypothetical protein Q7J34_00025 [Bacteroidales bacterium]|jgi:tetratricopeptide (TPR) repeat protein|nr:hypothetical protein [Bacteroidales bacterium]